MAAFYAIWRRFFCKKQLSGTTPQCDNQFAKLRLRRIPDVFLTGSLVFLVVACSSGQSATPVATPRSTTIPSGTVLYQSNWSRGLKDWQASAKWQVTQEYLQTDLSDNLSLTVPYKPDVPNYAVEFDLQVVNVPRDGGYFMLTADNIPGKKDGYQARVLGLLGPNPHNAATHPLAEVAIDPLEDAKDDVNYPAIDYEPGPNWRTYRVEVRGESVFFLVDGSRVSRSASAKTSQLSNGPIRLICGLAILRVKNFRISSL